MKQTQKEWARYIQDEIKKNGSYDNYRHAFVEYKDYLEECLLENPRDVEKVCQLAAVYNELNYQWDDIYKLLNEFIKRNFTKYWRNKDQRRISERYNGRRTFGNDRR